MAASDAVSRPSLSDRFAGRVRARDGWGLVLALAPALLFLPAVLAPPVNHDVAAILSFSQRWLGGERLYTDLIDVNPPLIFVLNLIPAGIASWTQLDAIEALRVCVFGYGAFAGWLAFRVRDRACEGVAERLFVDVLPALFLLAAGYDFGQREHLMALGALPYLLCAARRATGERPRGRVAAALLASVAFALKPHFLAIPALVEFGVIAERGFRRSRTSLRDPVPWIMGALWLAYLALAAGTISGLPGLGGSARLELLPRSRRTQPVAGLAAAANGVRDLLAGTAAVDRVPPIPPAPGVAQSRATTDARLVGTRRASARRSRSIRAGRTTSSRSSFSRQRVPGCSPAAGSTAPEQVRPPARSAASRLFVPGCLRSMHW